MAPPRYVPSKAVLEEWLAEDPRPTHQEMADRVFDLTGERVGRTAISVALMNAGLAKPKSRYKETLPWRVRVHHAKSYPARCLRLLGRRLNGGELTQAEADSLDNWLSKMKKDGLIVGYDPEDDQGFVYIDKKYKDHKNSKIPIRVKALHL